MVILAMRFDFRNPAMAGVSMADRYDAALDMAAWADEHGAYMVGVSEHHFSDDGYIPSPMLIAAGFAARTENARIGIASLVGPFHDPLRLAEDLAVLDHLTRGRLDVTISGGYVPAEFEAFGVPLKERPARMAKLFTTLKQAWTGEPFEYEGRMVRIAPTPFREGGPPLTMGGSSEAAARRAARVADGFTPSEGRFWQYYVDECLKLGKPDPGPCMTPDDMVTTYLAEDVDKGWAELGPYFLHETNSYGAWGEAAGVANPYKVTADVETLRASGQYRIITPDEYAAELKAMGDFAFAMWHPMVGGIPPERAWEALRLFERDVLPQVQ
jgi:alkanesulfonate monooxygenase SsuD/methylene tetrahydromethanopterin reductase-like flavin-dependent oxidoreductase (luciferase family)